MLGNLLNAVEQTGRLQSESDRTSGVLQTLEIIRPLRIWDTDERSWRGHVRYVRAQVRLSLLWRFISVNELIQSQLNLNVNVTRDLDRTPRSLGTAATSVSKLSGRCFNCCMNLCVFWDQHHPNTVADGECAFLFADTNELTPFTLTISRTSRWNIWDSEESIAGLSVLMLELQWNKIDKSLSDDGHYHIQTWQSFSLKLFQ